MPWSLDGDAAATCVLNTAAYGFLLCACEQGRQPVRAMAASYLNDAGARFDAHCDLQRLGQHMPEGRAAETPMEIVMAMRCRCLLLNAVMRDTPINACEKSNSQGKPWMSYMARQQQGVVLNAITFSALISTCENCKRPRKPGRLLVTPSAKFGAQLEKLQCLDRSLCEGQATN